MTNKNLTDTEIKQAIQCHKELDCDNCPLKNGGYCTKQLMGAVLELIERLERGCCND